MHELSIASSIAERVMEYASEHQDRRVVQVRLAVGELSCVQADQLCFCYQAITTDTPIAGSTLDIERLPAVVRCSSCGYHGPPKYWEDAQWLAPIPTLACPGCGEVVEAEQGHECAIRGISYAS